MTHNFWNQSRSNCIKFCGFGVFYLINFLDYFSFYKFGFLSTVDVCSCMHKHFRQNLPFEGFLFFYLPIFENFEILEKKTEEKGKGCVKLYTSKWINLRLAVIAIVMAEKEEKRGVGKKSTDMKNGNVLGGRKGEFITARRNIQMQMKNLKKILYKYYIYKQLMLKYIDISRLQRFCRQSHIGSS